LIASVLANGTVRMAKLDDADRCWVVAGLGRAGLTAQDIADRLGCSVRLVKAIRAEAMTELARMYQREASVFADEMRLALSELKFVRVECDAAKRELEMARQRIARTLLAQAAGEKPCGQCGAAMDKYNTYVHRGKRYCRACRRERQRRYEERVRASGLEQAR
jgi:UDP-N-acetylmuramoylalanine-D-glutamate ligase